MEMQVDIDLPLIMLIGGILILLVFSAFFSGSETALTAAQRSRIHRLAEDGSRRAEMAEKLINDRESVLGTVLLGNNLVNILASALATILMIRIFGDAGVLYATALMTGLVVVFCELLPKTFAITQPERAALGVALIMRGIIWVLWPLVAMARFTVRGIFHLFGYDPDRPFDVITAHDELRGAVDLHHREGAVKKRERDMIGGILDLDDVAVDDIMVHRKNIHMVDAGLPADEIIGHVLSSPYTRVPLWSGDPENIVGVVHAKDLLRVMMARQRDGVPADQTIDVLALASAPWFVPEGTTLRAQLVAFLARRSHFVLVVDEYGVLMGLVTLEDILEEIVGEISDEHDAPVRGVRIQPDGSYVTDGAVAIRDLNREFYWNLPDDEATTIAGLVIHEAQAIPEVGQVFTYYGFKFQILRRNRNAISSIRITPPPGSEPQPPAHQA
ncbi:MAG: HlyC/CorC family transporter [Alphaproteobacteria bacterium]|nr:HlyC/CorC family transporter [Alphaproteobacteria bacterium]